MAAERKVVVRVDISATGNLGEVLKVRAAQAKQLQDSVRAIPKQVSGVVGPAAMPPAATAAVVQPSPAISIAPASAGVGGMVQNRMAAKKMGYSPGMMWDDDDVRDFLKQQQAAQVGGAAAPSAKAAMPPNSPDRPTVVRPPTAARPAAVRPSTTTQPPTAVVAPPVEPAAAAMPAFDNDAAMRESLRKRKEKQLLRKQMESVGIDYGTQEKLAIGSRKQIAEEAATVGKEAHVRAVMQEVKLEEESLQLLKQKQAVISQAKLADLQSAEGRADALKTSSLTFQARGAAATTAGEQSRADRRSIGSTEHTAALKAEVAARWESAKNLRMETSAANRAEYGKVGGTLVTFGQRIESGGAMAAKGFAGMVATVAAASPAALQTFLGSVQLAAGEIGIMFIPTIVQVSKVLQDAAGWIRSFNDATGGIVGKVVGPILAVGAVAWVASKALQFMAPAFGLIQRGMVLLTGTANTAAVALGKVAASAGAASVMPMLSSTGGAATLMGGGGPAAAGGGGWKGAIGKGLGIAAVGAVGVQVASSAVGAVAGEGAGSAVSSIGNAAAIGAGIGSVIPVIGTAVGAVGGAIVGGVVHFWDDIKGVFSKGTKSAASAAEAKLAKLSMNFQGGESGFGDMHTMLQRESIRDPMQQAKANQEARAMEKLAAEIGGLNRAISGISQSWQVGN